MGGGFSKNKNGVNGDDSKAVAERSKDASTPAVKPTDLPVCNRWHKKQKFEDENSLIYSANDDYSELRNMLGEPLGQRYLGDFAKAENSHENFLAWIDMEEYRAIPTPDFQKCQAKQIFKKYIRKGAMMQLGGLDDEEIANFKELIDGKGKHPLDERAFVQLQHHTFRAMCTNTYARFKLSDKYQEYKTMCKKLYNRLSVEDFEYLEFLGGGAFGKVVRVRKKSTGREYAMKVVSKARMLEQLNNKDSKTKYERLNIERNVYANSSFPFIIVMDYAFQTDTECMLVIEFALGGTLRDLIRTYDQKRMPEDHARYVICQVMLGLRHLHYMNYVYRDLKPINILVTERGIIKLADMGLVARIDDTIKPTRDRRSAYNRAHSRLDAGRPEGFDESPDGRRFSIVGTMGYKAPEMLKAKKSEERGYGASADWWSLGVLSFELLAGHNPYLPKNKSLLGDKDPERVELDTIMNMKPPKELLPEEVRLQLSEACIDFLTDMLQTDPAKRLGTNAEGVKAIRSHPFFGCYDFDKMLELEIDPPYAPRTVFKPADKPQWKSFKEMMAKLEAADISILLGANVDTTVKERHQRYFKNWDYVSQATFRLEFGLQQRRSKRHKTLMKQEDTEDVEKEAQEETERIEAENEEQRRQATEKELASESAGAADGEAPETGAPAEGSVGGGHPPTAEPAGGDEEGKTEDRRTDQGETSGGANGSGETSAEATTS